MALLSRVAQSIFNEISFPATSFIIWLVFSATLGTLFLIPSALTLGCFAKLFTIGLTIFLNPESSRQLNVLPFIVTSSIHALISRSLVIWIRTRFDGCSESSYVLFRLFSSVPYETSFLESTSDIILWCRSTCLDILPACFPGTSVLQLSILQKELSVVLLYVK